MFGFRGYSAERLEFLLLIILRTSGLFLIAPILGYRTLSVPGLNIAFYNEIMPDTELVSIGMVRINDGD